MAYGEIWYQARIGLSGGYLLGNNIRWHGITQRFLHDAVPKGTGDGHGPAETTAL